MGRIEMVVAPCHGSLLLTLKIEPNSTAFTSNGYPFPQRKTQNTPKEITLSEHSLVVVRIRGEVNHPLVTAWPRSGPLQGEFKQETVTGAFLESQGRIETGPPERHPL